MDDLQLRKADRDVVRRNIQISGGYKIYLPWHGMRVWLIHIGRLSHEISEQRLDDLLFTTVRRILDLPSFFSPI